MAQAGNAVRIGKEHHQTLRQLAKRMGESMQTVVEKAIDELSRELFFKELNAAYAGLRNDRKAWEEEISERRWAVGTVPDDEAKEVWSEDGSVTIRA